MLCAAAPNEHQMIPDVNSLHELGQRATQITKQAEADATIILQQKAFDPPLYLGTRMSSVKFEAAGRIDYERVPVSGAYPRRPLAGFNPLTYALQCPNYDRHEGQDPLAHYLS